MEKNKIEQLEQGIPNKLAFLLIGNPGCGKTSLVYAIANETKKILHQLICKIFQTNPFCEQCP